MNMDDGLLEGRIKRELTKIHKTELGKGPDNITIKIYDNILTVVYRGALTTIEESLLSVEDGKEMVESIRDKLFENRRDFFKSFFEKHTGVPVDIMNSCFDNDYSTLYCFVIFERNVRTSAH